MLEHIRNISALETEISDAGRMRWVWKEKANFRILTRIGKRTRQEKMAELRRLFL